MRKLPVLILILATTVLAYDEADLIKLEATLQCERCDLSGANLNKAFLSEANLTGANLSKANLAEAKLFDTNLSFANLRFANLTKAKDINILHGAKLF